MAANKQRSPNYPQISLPEAVERVKRVYRKEYTHPATREVVAIGLGYAGINGASSGTISAIVKYGLLETVKDQLRVSQRAVSIIELPSGHPEHAAAVQEAAFAPALFSELHEQYGSKLPSDENMRVFLIRKGFNPGTTHSVIKSYKETVAWMTDEGAFDQGHEVEPVHQGSDVSSELGQEAVSQLPFASMASPTAPLPTPILPSPYLNGDVVLSFKIAAECDARVVLSGQPTQEAVKRLIQHLELSLDTFPSGAEGIPVEATATPSQEHQLTN